ncbi:hypothetical protein BDW74DRAFT_103509 [Aspergillus multicolor]|uniref:uncharacterized protein n=1 Tax=Aspergillus multicolor TaxID=41759 RepID=UPI003CCE2EAC
MRRFEEPEVPYFCHICGAPPTWRGLLADWTLEYLDPEEDDFDHRDYRYMDFMPGQEENGYDARILPPRKIRWLDAVRLVTNKIADTDQGTLSESPVPLLTPLAGNVRIDKPGTFHYPDNTNVLRCNIDGFLVHDACLKILERVHQENTCSKQELDLQKLWNWLEAGLEDRNNDLVDWGFGDAFEGGDYPGQRFDDGYQEWIPLKGSMWTVMDPEGPFGCQPLIDRASASGQPGYAFSFNVNPIQASPSGRIHSTSSVLSLLPRELQLSILELLPTPSVLNLFLASFDFRRCAEHLPPSFWKSRLFFDIPWCADIILSQLRRQDKQGESKVQFGQLLRFLREFYESSGSEPDDKDLEFKGLRNRRRIWLNCERILGEMERQYGCKGKVGRSGSESDD